MSNNHLTHQKSETINHQNSSWLQCLLHSSMQLRTWVPCVLPGDTKSISFSSWKQNFCSLGYISVTTHWSIFWCDTCSLHRAKTTNAIKTQHSRKLCLGENTHKVTRKTPQQQNRDPSVSSPPPSMSCSDVHTHKDDHRQLAQLLP